MEVHMHRSTLALIALSACMAACTPRGTQAQRDAVAEPRAPADASADRTARADAADAASPLVAIDAEPAHAPATHGEATGSGRWHLQESDPPRAAWGVPDSEGMLTLGCDRAGARLVLERQAIGVPDDVRVVVVEADGVRMDYPAERREDALAPVLVTRIALDAPIVDRLLMARRMVVTAGSDAIATTAPGDALRAVVDACRREPAA
jgi:hypothetical protein